MFPNWELFVFLLCEGYCKKHFTYILDQAQRLRGTAKVLV
jgi:hypothetical protein